MLLERSFDGDYFLILNVLKSKKLHNFLPNKWDLYSRLILGG